MMDRRLVLHSNCPSPPLDDSKEFLRHRQPLSEASGNSQLCSTSSYDGITKDTNLRADMPVYDIPALPIQPTMHLPQRRLGSTPLVMRRQSVKKQKHRMYSGKQNPIYDSPQYQAYRNKQSKECSADGQQVWPNILEDAFLDALVDIPLMGRKKFTLNLRPYGRNELITEYLWIAYKHSLPPGVVPDKNFRRERKQVSSHIQVLKGFLKDHPAYPRLFPPPKSQKNSFDESFKNDPCLLALLQGRLPPHRYARYSATKDDANVQVSMRPAKLWLHITDSEEIGAISHTYTRLAAERPRESLDSIPNWRQKFPYLERLGLQNQINCDVIHMDATLELMQGHVPNGSFLTAKTELSIPGRELEGCSWKTTTRLIKPPELYGEESKDPPGNVYENSANVLSVNDLETRIKIPYPPHSWAYAFTSLTELQSRYEAQRRNPHPDDINHLPARDYLEKVSMYQEVESCRDRDSPWIRRAIIIWTFHKAKHGHPGSTIWRYLDPAPSRITCMSPAPHAGQRYTANMNENFHTLLDTPTEINENFLSSFSAPSAPAGLQSPFEGPNYSFPATQYDAENISFDSQTSLDRQTTFDNSEASALHIFMDNGNVNFGDFDSATTGYNWMGYNTAAAPQAGWDVDAGNTQWNGVLESRAGTWMEGVENNAKIDWSNVEHLEGNLDWSMNNGNDNEQQPALPQQDWSGDEHQQGQIVELPEGAEQQWTPAAPEVAQGEHNWEVVHDAGVEADWSATGAVETKQELEQPVGEDSWSALEEEYSQQVGIHNLPGAAIGKWEDGNEQVGLGYQLVERLKEDPECVSLLDNGRSYARA